MKRNPLKNLGRVKTIVKDRMILLVCIIFGAMYGFLIISGGSQTSRQPSKGMVLDQINAATSPSIDEQAAESLNRLQDQNVEVRALFDEARNNPFSE